MFVFQTEHGLSQTSIKCIVPSYLVWMLQNFAKHLHFFQVSINGIESFTYKHRLRNLKAIQHLIINGDIRIQSVTVM